MLWPAGLGREKTDAALRISFARRSSAFFRLSRLISACSSLVRPGRVPASTSAWRTHLRSVSAVPMPSFSATAQIAGQSEGVLRPHLGDHPDRSLTQLRRVVSRSTSHGSIFLSRSGASGNSGAVQRALGLVVRVNSV